MPRGAAFSAGVTRSGIAEAIALAQMPKLFLWTQVAICVFVLAGIVIAITKLA